MKWVNDPQFKEYLVDLEHRYADYSQEYCDILRDGWDDELASYDNYSYWNDYTCKAVRYDNICL